MEPDVLWQAAHFTLHVSWSYDSIFCQGMFTEQTLGGSPDIYLARIPHPFYAGTRFMALLIFRQYSWALINFAPVRPVPYSLH